MPTISQLLQYILSKRYGEEVRGAIHDAIEKCYQDVNSATLREDAFQAALQAAIDHGDIPGMVIADNSISGAKIQDGTIPLRKLSEAVQITVDSALSDSSTNPVQNKVIKGAIDELNGSLDDDILIPIEQSNKFDRLINYGYNQSYDLASASTATNATRVGIKRRKTVVVLNTSGNNPNAAYIRLDGEVVRTGTASDIIGWTGGIPLIDGHQYEIVVRLLSGTSTLSGNTYIPIVASRVVGTSSSPKISEETVGNEYHRVFEADDQNWLFFINVVKNANLSNAKFLIMVCDLTAEFNYFKSKLDDIEAAKISATDGNLFNPNTVTVGACIKTTDGSLYTAGDANKCASDYIEVTPGQVYILMPRYNTGSGGIFGMAFYDSNKTYVSGAVHSTTTTSSLKTWVFRVPDNDSIVYMRFSTWKAALKQTYLAEYTWDRMRAKASLVSYEGDSIDLTPKGFMVVPGFKMDIGNQHQDAAVWGDKMFLFGDSSYKVAHVIDLASYETVPISMTDWGDHNSTVGFTRSFYDSGDKYPIICLSGERSHKSHFYRITENNGAYTATKLMRVNYPSMTSSHQYPECIIDTEENLMYIRAVLNGDTVQSSNLKLIKYHVPDQFSTDITLENVPYSDEHPYGYLDIIPFPNYKFVGNGSLQGCCVFDGKLFNVCGQSGSECLNVMDLNTGRRIAWIDLRSYMTGEPELCVYYKGRIIIGERETKLLYEIYT